MEPINETSRQMSPSPRTLQRSLNHSPVLSSKPLLRNKLLARVRQMSHFEKKQRKSKGGRGGTATLSAPSSNTTSNQPNHSTVDVAAVPASNPTGYSADTTKKRNFSPSTFIRSPTFEDVSEGSPSKSISSMDHFCRAPCKFVTLEDMKGQGFSLADVDVVDDDVFIHSEDDCWNESVTEDSLEDSVHNNIRRNMLTFDGIFARWRDQLPPKAQLRFKQMIEEDRKFERITESAEKRFSSHRKTIELIQYHARDVRYMRHMHMVAQEALVHQLDDAYEANNFVNSSRELINDLMTSVSNATATVDVLRGVYHAMCITRDVLSNRKKQFRDHLDMVERCQALDIEEMMERHRRSLSMSKKLSALSPEQTQLTRHQQQKCDAKEISHLVEMHRLQQKYLKLLFELDISTKEHKDFLGNQHRVELDKLRVRFWSDLSDIRLEIYTAQETLRRTRAVQRKERRLSELAIHHEAELKEHETLHEEMVKKSIREEKLSQARRSHQPFSDETSNWDFLSHGGNELGPEESCSGDSSVEVSPNVPNVHRTIPESSAKPLSAGMFASGLHRVNDNEEELGNYDASVAHAASSLKRLQDTQEKLRQTYRKDREKMIQAYNQLMESFTAVIWPHKRKDLLAVKEGELRQMSLRQSAEKEEMELQHLRERKIQAEFLKDQEKARQEEEIFSGCMSSVLDPLVLTDHKCVIIRWNDAAQKMFGYTEQEVLGQNVSMLTKPDIKHRHHLFVQRYLDSGVGRVIGTAGRVVEGVTKKGTIIPIRLSVNPFQVNHRTYFVGTLHLIENNSQTHDLKVAIDSLVNMLPSMSPEVAQRVRELRTIFTRQDENTTYIAPPAVIK